MRFQLVPHAPPILCGCTITARCTPSCRRELDNFLSRLVVVPKRLRSGSDSQSSTSSITTISAFLCTPIPAALPMQVVGVDPSISAVARMRFDENLIAPSVGEDVDFHTRLGPDALLLINPKARLINGSRALPRTPSISSCAGNVVPLPQELEPRHQGTDLPALAKHRLLNRRFPLRCASAIF
jgi:hypothetical protein